MTPEKQRRSGGTRNPERADSGKEAPQAQNTQVQKGTNTVSYGVHKLTELNLEGQTVADIRKQLQTPFNIISEARNLVNGKEVGGDYRLGVGDCLEFVKLAGSKG